MTTVLRAYTSYNFKDKAPIVDELRTVIRDAGMSYRQVHEESGLSLACLYHLFSGPTRCPNYATVARILHACGRDLKIVNRARIISLAEHAERKRKRA